MKINYLDNAIVVEFEEKEEIETRKAFTERLKDAKINYTEENNKIKIENSTGDIKEFIKDIEKNLQLLVADQSRIDLFKIYTKDERQSLVIRLRISAQQFAAFLDVCFDLTFDLLREALGVGMIQAYTAAKKDDKLFEEYVKSVDLSLKNPLTVLRKVVLSKYDDAESYICTKVLLVGSSWKLVEKDDVFDAVWKPRDLENIFQPERVKSLLNFMDGYIGKHIALADNIQAVYARFLDEKDKKLEDVNAGLRDGIESCRKELEKAADDVFLKTIYTQWLHRLLLKRISILIQLSKVDKAKVDEAKVDEAIALCSEILDDKLKSHYAVDDKLKYRVLSYRATLYKIKKMSNEATKDDKARAELFKKINAASLKLKKEHEAAIEQSQLEKAKDVNSQIVSDEKEALKLRQQELQELIGEPDPDDILGDEFSPLFPLNDLIQLNFNQLLIVADAMLNQLVPDAKFGDQVVFHEDDDDLNPFDLDAIARASLPPSAPKPKLPDQKHDAPNAPAVHAKAVKVEEDDPDLQRAIGQSLARGAPAPALLGPNAPANIPDQKLANAPVAPPVKPAQAPAIPAVPAVAALQPAPAPPGVIPGGPMVDDELLNYFQQQQELDAAMERERAAAAAADRAAEQLAAIARAERERLRQLEQKEIAAAIAEIEKVEAEAKQRAQQQAEANRRAEQAAALHRQEKSELEEALEASKREAEEAAKINQMYEDSKREAVQQNAQREADAKALAQATQDSEHTEATRAEIAKAMDEADLAPILAASEATRKEEERNREREQQELAHALKMSQDEKPQHNNLAARDLGQRGGKQPDAYQAIIAEQAAALERAVADAAKKASDQRSLGAGDAKAVDQVPLKVAAAANSSPKQIPDNKDHNNAFVKPAAAVSIQFAESMSIFYSRKKNQELFEAEQEELLHEAFKKNGGDLELVNTLLRRLSGPNL